MNHKYLLIVVSLLFLVIVPFSVSAQTSSTDIIPPSVLITNPAVNSIVANTINITAFATDTVRVIGVKFFADDKLIGSEDFYPPYSVSWYTRSVNNGFHTLKAEARDLAGNKANSSIAVDVENVTSTKFSINDRVVTTASVYVRLEPSISSQALAMLFYSNKGIVMGGPAFANNYFWWQVKFDNGLTGWVAENYLVKQTTGFVPVSSTLAIVSYSVATTINTAKIIWQTNISADGQVEYGTSLASMNDTYFYSSLVTIHAVSIFGLIPNTFYIYRIKTKDKSGNLVFSSYGNFTTKVASDNISPVVSMFSPVNGSVIFGTSSLIAQASDNVKMGSVQFFIDGKTIGFEDTIAPYSIVWDSRTVPNGSHAIMAKARDAVGNQSFSSPVSVTVDNKLSTKFSINDRVVTTASVYVRLEPSISSQALAMLFYSNKGIVMGGPAFANNYFWWQVKFDNGLTGWVAENYVVKADIISPSIYFISPQNNSNVSGTVVVSASASDNVGIYKVEFYRNDVIIGSDFSAPYSVSWSTKGLAAGQYILSAKAYDAAGNVGIATSVAVTISSIVSGNPPDTLVPSISIISPINNSTVSSTITISANATDNIGVSGVQFKLDGVNLGVEDTTVPYSISWNTASSTNGTHTISAVARDAAGNLGISSVITITVSNSVVVVNPTGLVTVQGGKFYLNGKPFYFSGTNAYHLQTYEKLNSSAVTAALDMYAANNMSVVRTWGFHDGTDCGYWSGDPVIQTAPGVYDEQGLVYLDRVVKKAKDRNLKLIFALNNFWYELGGICQYNKWAGYGPGGTHPTAAEAYKFYTDSVTKGWFKNYITMLLNRVNTQTGIAYKDEPAIMAWEIINEGRNPYSGNDFSILRNWYQEMARHIKNIDTKHLVGTGEEGFDEGSSSQYSSGYSNTYFMRSQNGTSFIQNTQIPEIDFSSAHLYPDVFGFTRGSWSSNGILYINDHAKISHSYNKPFLLGEYGSGYFEGWVADSPVKQGIYEKWWETIEQYQTDGDLIWQFVQSLKCSESAGNICSSRDPNLTSAISSHGFKMRNKTNGSVFNLTLDTLLPVVSLSMPADRTFVSGIVNLSGTATDNIGVTKVEFYRNSTLISAKTVPPYTAIWDSSGTVSSTLSIRAYDATFNFNIASANVTSSIIR